MMQNLTKIKSPIFIFFLQGLSVLISILYFTGGGNLGVLPLNTTGRLTEGLPLLKAHGG